MNKKIKKSRMFLIILLHSIIDLVLIFKNQHFFNLVAPANGVNHFYSFIHFPEAGVIAIEMGGVVATVANEKLRAGGVAAGMRHRQNPPIVVLVVAVELALDCVTRSPGTCAIRATALNHKVRDHPMKSEAVVKTLFGQFYKIGYGFGSIFFVKLYFHYPFAGVYLCCQHIFLFLK